MILLFKFVFLIFCVAHLTAGQNFQDLSYSNIDIHASNSFQQTNTGYQSVGVTSSTTQTPSTTKAGFFKGIKNYFRGTPTEATTSTPVTVPTRAPVPVPVPVLPQRPPVNQPNMNTRLSYPVAPSQPNINNPNRPQQNFPSSPLPPNSFSPPSSNSDMRPSSPLPPRDYVAPGTPTIPQAPGSIPNVTPSRPQSPTGTRDYVRPVTPPRPPSALPPSTYSSPSISPGMTRPPPPLPSRDYVAPITPPRPASIPNVVPATPPRPQSPSSSGTRDYVAPTRPQTPSTGDFPPLGPPPRRPSNQDFPALPSRSSGGTNQPTLHPVWSTGATPTQPSTRVQFIPNQPTPRTPTNRPPVRPTFSHSASPSTSSNDVTDAEITEVTEALLSKDVNNPFKYITVNIQGRTQSSSSEDDAALPLLSINESAVYAIPTIAKMRVLYNNYELDTHVNEHVTPNERREENEFLDAIMATSVMRRAMLFLQDKGKVTADPRTHRDLLKTIWFNMYSRGGGKIGSSAFEHVFLAEMKDGTVNGLHNWLYFYEEEKAGNLDYKGYIKKFDIGNKGMVMKVRFSLNNVIKPVNSMFIGTSPELDMAIYTICFELRADGFCPISLGGKTFNMKTNTFRYRGKNLIGSAYAEI